jgi:hypothetical protein
MNNKNIADISTFEALQAEQHDRTGMSQMSVFNAIFTGSRELDPTEKAKADKLKKQFTDLEKQFVEVAKRAVVGKQKTKKIIEDFKTQKAKEHDDKVDSEVTALRNKFIPIVKELEKFGIKTETTVQPEESLYVGW